MKFLAFVFAIAVASTSAAVPVDSPSAKFVFEKRRIKLGKHTITVEIADTPDKRERGLMFREKLGADEGMLFVFDYVQPLAFWMKNTLIPLSIGYFDESRRLVDVKEMVPAVLGEARPPSYPSKAPGKYALEMNKGWFSKKGTKPGATFSFVDDPKKRP